MPFLKPAISPRTRGPSHRALRSRFNARSLSRFGSPISYLLSARRGPLLYSSNRVGARHAAPKFPANAIVGRGRNTAPTFPLVTVHVRCAPDCSPSAGFAFAASRRESTRPPARSDHGPDVASSNTKAPPDFIVASGTRKIGPCESFV